MKKCTLCNKLLKLDSFPPQKEGLMERASTCYECRREQAKQNRQTPDGFIANTYSAQKARAKKERILLHLILKMNYLLL